LDVLACARYWMCSLHSLLDVLAALAAHRTCSGEIGKA
jgi:hypothetical protein